MEQETKDCRYHIIHWFMVGNLHEMNYHISKSWSSYITVQN